MFHSSKPKLFIVCSDSNGLTGFNYSHDGYWTGYTDKGTKTAKECASSCTQDCFGIDTAAGTSTGRCYHYSNTASLTTANQVSSSSYKAYIKCSGSNE